MIRKIINWFKKKEIVTTDGRWDLSTSTYEKTIKGNSKEFSEVMFNKNGSKMYVKLANGNFDVYNLGNKWRGKK